MRTLLASTGAAIGLILCASFGAPASAEAIATRCGPQGCDRIKCHNDGSYCVRFSDYDARYNGYIGDGRYADGYGGYSNGPYVNGYSGNSGYGGYGNGYYNNGYYGNGYNANGNYANGYTANGYSGSRYIGNEYTGTGAYSGYNNGYYGGATYGNGTYGGYSGSHFVCDREGDRCYTAVTPFWDYREYYRRHGYHWNF